MNIRHYMNLVEEVSNSITPEQAAERVNADIMDDDLEHTTFERVIWEKDQIVESNSLDMVGFNNIPGMYAVHVGDPEFWFNQLVNDYGRDPIAYVMEIQCLPTDVLVEDVQYAIPDEFGNKGYSAIIFTTRSHLVEGRDFRYVRTLTENDLEQEENYEDEENGDNADEY